MGRAQGFGQCREKSIQNNFLKLVDDTPLIEASYQRALKVVGPEDIATITNKEEEDI